MAVNRSVVSLSIRCLLAFIMGTAAATLAVKLWGALEWYVIPSQWTDMRGPYPVLLGLGGGLLLGSAVATITIVLGRPESRYPLVAGAVLLGSLLAFALLDSWGLPLREIPAEFVRSLDPAIYPTTGWWLERVLWVLLPLLGSVAAAQTIKHSRDANRRSGEAAGAF